MVLSWALNVGFAGSGTAAAAPPFTIFDSLVVIQSHLAESAYFDGGVILGEPTSPAQGNTMTAAIWGTGTRIPVTTLVTTIKVYLVSVRLYMNAFTEPRSFAQLRLADGLDATKEALLGDFTLGGTVRNIDVGGQHGASMRAQWGHDSVGSGANRMQEVVTLEFGVIVNDTATFAA